MRKSKRSMGTVGMFCISLAIVFAMGIAGVHASLISDTGFDEAFVNTPTNEGFDASSNDNDPYGFWWTADTGDGDRIIRNETGGNPGAWAQRGGLFNTRPKAIAYAILDEKSTTGIQSLTFDLRVDTVANTGNYELRMDVYGILDASNWGTGKFEMNRGSDDLAILDLPTNASLIAGKDYTGDLVVGDGWQGFSLDVPLGAGGYDVIVVRAGIRGVIDTGMGGFDNVTLIPEPASIGLLGLFGVLFLIRRRVMK